MERKILVLLGFVIIILATFLITSYNAYIIRFQDRPLDINNDGKINIYDLVFIARCQGAKSSDRRCFPTADLNSDGKINNIDLDLIKKRL